jgi:hypothetical protein
MKMVGGILLVAGVLILNYTELRAQNGIIWNNVSTVATADYGNLHPRVVTNGSGDPLVIWGRSSDESVFFSRWDGTSFSTPLKLNPGWLTIAIADWMGPDIACKGDTVYVVMKQTPEDQTNSHVYLLKSLDGGISFGNPIQVDFIGDSISRFPALTTDENGNPLISFMKFNALFGDSRWVATKSEDGGNTFSPDTKASGWSAPGALVCDCCPGSVIVSGSNAYVLFRDNLSNIRDVWVGISLNGGLSFNQGIAIDQQDWFLMSCPASGPDGVIIGDTLYSVFMNGASGLDLVYLGRSSVADPSNSPGIELTGNFAGLSIQNYPRIAAYGSAAAIAWKQVVNGDSELPILFTNNVTSGFPTAYDIIAEGGIDNTDIALADGSVFVVWQDNNSGTVKYRSGTFDPGSTEVNEIHAKSVSVFPNPASDVLNIDCPLFYQGGQIEILTPLNKKIYSSASQANSILMDVSGFPNGVYFVAVVAGENAVVTKFIVQH